jgi:hypothetical protein
MLILRGLSSGAKVGATGTAVLIGRSRAGVPGQVPASDPVASWPRLELAAGTNWAVSASTNSLADVLRLLDARTGSYAELRPARVGLLRVCAHVPQAATAADITALRVLLVADLLARTAELGGLQVLTALEFSGPAARQAALESHADALGIHPSTERTVCHDAPLRLGGPIDVHLISQAASLEPGQDGLAARPCS